MSSEPQDPAEVDAAPLPPRKIVTPTFLILALVVLFLPWMSFGCTMKGEGSATLTTQTGIQTITGDFTPSQELLAEREKGFDDKADMAGKENQDTAALKKVLGIMRGDHTFDAAPLMIVYVACLLVAIAAGFGMRASKARIAIVGGSVVLAIGVLVVQIVVGFPAMQLSNALGAIIEKQLGAKANQIAAFHAKFMIGVVVTALILVVGLILVCWELMTLDTVLRGKRPHRTAEPKSMENPFAE